MPGRVIFKIKIFGAGKSIFNYIIILIYYCLDLYIIIVGPNNKIINFFAVEINNYFKRF